MYKQGFRTFIVSIGMIFVAAMFPAMAGTIVSDGTFAPSDWSLTSYNAYGNGGTVTATQETSGGNPGDYRLIQEAVNGAPSGSTSSSVVGVDIYTAASYDPSISGPLTSLDFSIDAECPANGGSCFGQGQGVFAALVQGGNTYVDFLGVTNANSSWNTLTADGLTAASFGLLDFSSGGYSNPSVNPDFTAGGAPIAFGFATYNSTGTGDSGYEIDAGYDNFRIDAVPEPVSLVLLATALTGAAIGRRRRTEAGA